MTIENGIIESTNSANIPDNSVDTQYFADTAEQWADYYFGDNYQKEAREALSLQLDLKNAASIMPNGMPRWKAAKQYYQLAERCGTEHPENLPKVRTYTVKQTDSTNQQ